MDYTYWTSLCLVLFLASSSALADEKEYQGEIKKSVRDPKVFSLFSIVTFKNDGCRSQENRNGTCFTSTECTDKGGKKSGGCAAGFGVCCIFLYQDSGAQISQNCAYIQSPGFPSTFTASMSSTLSYTIYKCSSDVCALRLDLETFTTSRGTTAAPTEDNTCGDVFTVTSSSQGASPEICGENSGQHIYYELGKESGASATLSFTFSTAAAVAGATRTFEIKVTQIPCYANYRPPSGCLQYHEGLTGRITNFNWGATSTANQVHLANQRQSICIRQNEGYCCVRYSLCDFVPTTITEMGHMQPSWKIDSSADIVGNAAKAVDTGTDCTNDYLEIPGASNTCNQGFNEQETSRLCGLQFGAVGTIDMQKFAISNICSCNAPFTLNIVTDATAIDGTGKTDSALGDRGLCLDYQQIPCN